MSFTGSSKSIMVALAVGAIAESSKHAEVFLVRRASTRNCRMSLTSIRCFQASATTSMRRLRTTRIQKSVSDLGTKQRTNPSPLWTDFSIRGLHSSAGAYWTELSRTNPLTFSLVTRHGNITRPPSGTGYVAPVLPARSLSNSLQLSRIKVNFKNSNGDLLKTVEVNEGDDILSIAHEHDIDLEGA